MAAENGTTAIIATPHVIDVSTTLTWDSIRRSVEELQKEADRNGIPVTIYPGAETELNFELLELMRKDHSVFCLAAAVPSSLSLFLFTLKKDRGQRLFLFCRHGRTGAGRDLQVAVPFFYELLCLYQYPERLGCQEVHGGNSLGIKSV